MQYSIHLLQSSSKPEIKRQTDPMRLTSCFQTRHARPKLVGLAVVEIPARSLCPSRLPPVSAAAPAGPGLGQQAHTGKPVGVPGVRVPWNPCDREPPPRWPHRWLGPRRKQHGRHLLCVPASLVLRWHRQLFIRLSALRTLYKSKVPFNHSF